MKVGSHHVDRGSQATETPSQTSWVLGALGIGSAVIGVGAVGIAVVVALIGMSLTVEGCELESPETTGREWCRTQRPARPFLTMANEAAMGVMPSEKFSTFVGGLFSTITDAPTEVSTDRRTMFEAIRPDPKPSGAQITADRTPAVQASALRLDGYCARVER